MFIGDELLSEGESKYFYLLPSEKDVIKDFYDGLDDITDEKKGNDDE